MSLTLNEQIDIVKKLREITGIGLMDCKMALLRYEFDINKTLKAIRSGECNPWKERTVRVTSKPIMDEDNI